MLIFFKSSSSEGHFAQISKPRGYSRKGKKKTSENLCVELVSLKTIEEKKTLDSKIIKNYGQQYHPTRIKCFIKTELH